MTLWLTCHQKLATKTRLVRYGIVANNTCCFCDAEETTAHLFFGCTTMRKVWKDILVWIDFYHESDTWDREIIWLLRYGSDKGWKAALLRLAVTETIYDLWNYRNEHCFGKPKDIDTIRNNIINMITYGVGIVIRWELALQSWCYRFREVLLNFGCLNFWLFWGWIIGSLCFVFSTFLN